MTDACDYRGEFRGHSNFPRPFDTPARESYNPAMIDPLVRIMATPAFLVGVIASLVATFIAWVIKYSFKKASARVRELEEGMRRSTLLMVVMAAMATIAALTTHKLEERALFSALALADCIVILSFLRKRHPKPPED